MGKRTDTLLKAVSDASDKATMTSGTLLQLFTIWEGIQDEWDKWEHELVKDLNWETNHPYGKRRVAVWQKGKDLREKLRADVHELNMALGAFRTFLQKKEKSKNPFKSKKSLPGAKAMLKTYDGIMNDYNTVIRDAGTLFR
jgi:hypothetical protein